MTRSSCHRVKAYRPGVLFLLGLWYWGASLLPAVAQSGTLQFKSLAFAGREGGTPALVTVSRVNGTAGTVSVDFFTEDGTAMGDVDYVPTNGTLTFGPGVASLTFSVVILNDGQHEPTETVTLQLVNPGGGAVIGGVQNATLSLSDNDPCVVALVPVSGTLPPEGGSGTFLLNSTPGCPWTVQPSANWVSVITPGGDGTNVVAYSVDPNTNTALRSATLRVGARVFTVTQLGVPPPDVTKPVVSVLSPASGARVTNLPLVVTGRATDARGVDLVEYRLEHAAGTNDWQPAEGTTNWSVTLSSLSAGANTVRVRARDTSGNESLHFIRSFQHVVVSPLTLVLQGEGTVTPNLQGQLLEVGRTYLITAAPRPANLFSNWTGDLTTSTAKLSFRMQTNLQLQANFVPNPFLPLRGAYDGLILNEGPVRHESSGFLSVSTTDAGAYSAKLILGGQLIPLSGRFALDGRASNTITRVGSNTLTVRFGFDFTDPHGLLVGTVTGGNWSAQLEAHRSPYQAVTNPCPHAGRFTVLLPGAADPEQAPPGTSIGAVTVDAGGRLSWTGTLADGTPVLQRVPLSAGGKWPLFVRLYNGGGGFLGWQTFSEQVDQDLAGVATWNRPARAGGTLYTNGFAHAALLTGARYVPPATPQTPLLSFTNLVAAFSFGDLEVSFNNPLVLKPGNVFGNLATNRATLTWTLPTGLFSGSVAVPGSSRTLLFKGAWHPKQDRGAGFFPGLTEGGYMTLQPSL